MPSQENSSPHSLQQHSGHPGSKIVIVNGSPCIVTLLLYSHRWKERKIKLVKERDGKSARKTGRGGIRK
jgi:hypothetical protein